MSIASSTSTNDKSQRLCIISKDAEMCDSKSFYCPKCTKNYEFQAKANVFLGRLPIILTCEHTICEDCIRTGFLNNLLVCPVCDLSYPCADLRKNNIQEIFPVNYYIFGKILYSKPANDFSLMSQNPHLLQTHFRNQVMDAQSNLSPAIKCCQIKCGLAADFNCIDCEEYYCKECCDSIHKSAKGLKNHNIRNITDGGIPKITDRCKHHAQYVLDFYCKTCNENICMNCVVSNHRLHDIKNESEVQQEDKPYFEGLLVKAEEMLKILKTTQQHIGLNIQKNSSMPMTKTTISELDKAISNYFSSLHGKLQLLERKLKDSANCSKVINIQTLTKLQSDVTANIRTIQTLLTYAKDAANNTGVKVNVEKITEMLENAIKLPCFLIGGQTSNYFFEGIEIFDNLSQLITLKEEGERKEYKLVTGEDLPDDFVMPEYIEEPCARQEPTQILRRDSRGSENNPKVPSQPSSQRSHPPSQRSHLTSHRSHPSSQRSNSSSQRSNNPSPASSTSSRASEIKKSRLAPSFKDLEHWIQNDTAQKKSQTKLPLLQKLDAETVIVTHINNPDSFYVQVVSRAVDLKKLQNDIDLFIRNMAPMATQPEVNKIYLVKYREQNKKNFMWSRAVLQEIINNTMKPTYSVFFLDWGNTQVVEKDSMREISQSLLQQLPFAYHCRLYNTFPKNKKWDTKAVKLMAQMLTGCEVVMKILEPNKECLEVDLFTITAGGGDVSVIQALVYIGHAVMSNESLLDNFTYVKTKSCKVKIFERTEKFKEGQTLNVTIVHVENPHKIFVHKYENAGRISALYNDMINFYGNGKKKYAVYIPEKDMVVAVLYEDGRWYRGRVIDVVQGIGTVIVLLVDYGKLVKVGWSNLKLLMERFTVIESQAIEVRLDDITPIKDKWSSKATKLLENYELKRTTLKMIVTKSNSNEVALFEMAVHEDLCINALLVRQNLAVSTGQFGEVSSWPNTVNDGDDEEGRDETYHVQLMNTIQGQKKIIGTDDNNESVSSCYKNLPKKPVKILACKSPGLFFVNFTEGGCVKELAALHLSIQEHFLSHTLTPEEWKINDRCIVFDSIKKQYFRAKILETMDDNCFLVRTLDTGLELEVPAKNLGKLGEDFTKYPDFAIPCHLAAIRPAGNPDKWSIMAVEYFQELVKKYREFFLSKYDNFDLEKSSLPVIIWFTEFIPAGPLDCSKTLYHSVNEVLIRIGLALKNPTNMNLESQNIETEASTCLNLKLVQKSFDETSDNDVNKSNDTNNCEQSQNSEESIPAQGYSSKRAKSIDWNKLIQVEEMGQDLEVASITSWITPPPLQKHKFKAIVTNIDENGIFYFHDFKSEAYLQEMKGKTKTIFDDIPEEPEDTEWLPGQICTAKFYLDQGWYRGKVVENNGTELKVLFVDYGNEEKCNPCHLRKKIMYTKLPIFAHMGKLDGVVPPGGTWLTSQIDTMHAELVDKHDVEIQLIAEEIPGKATSIIVKVGEKNVNAFINKHMYDKANKHMLHKYQQNNDDSDEGSDEDLEINAAPCDVNMEEESVAQMEISVEPNDSEINLSDDEIMDTSNVANKELIRFKRPKLPDVERGELIKCAIINVLSYNELIFEICDERFSNFTSAFNFEEMSGEINEEGPHQPILYDLITGQACITQFSEDNIWYRAEIVSLDDLSQGQVLVWFVDFGNFEYAARDKIRAVKRQWASKPLAQYCATIHSMKLTDDKFQAEVFEEMEKLTAEIKMIEIVKEKPNLEVQVYNDDESSFAYEQLLVDNLVRLEFEEKEDV